MQIGEDWEKILTQGDLKITTSLIHSSDSNSLSKGIYFQKLILLNELLKEELRG